MILLAIRLLFLALCGYAWRMGGSDSFPKGVRRFGVPGLILIKCIIFFDWIGLISIPLLVGAASLGYGERSALMKVTRSKYITRLACGLAYSLASIFILRNNWALFGWHIAICSIGVMLAGNQIFKFEDKREEAFIGVLFSWIPLFA